jgi:murein DD-endopeptidase MepM/ murein hydrolase activator NlpD
MVWPVSGKVSSGFGRRGKRHMHAGIDIPMPKGTPIAAAQDGVVLEVSTNKSRKYRGYGNAALIDHGGGIVTMYAHCQNVSVKAGQRVKQGDIVGTVGNTGRTTTHHIHFEVRKNGKAVDPIPYLASR